MGYLVFKEGRALASRLAPCWCIKSMLLIVPIFVEFNAALMLYLTNIIFLLHVEIPFELGIKDDFKERLQCTCFGRIVE